MPEPYAQGSRILDRKACSPGPAAIGAILGSSVPLALAVTETWQVGVLTAGALLLLVARRGILTTLLLAGAAGVVLAVAGAPLPS